MAGGTGTRLWPMSRDSKPKQFQAFVGNKTMLQQTYARLSFLNKKDIFLATNEQYTKIVKKQLPRLTKNHLIQESAMRDTGPSIFNAAWKLAEAGYENEVMAVIYADHLIQNTLEFKKALREALNHAKKTQQIGVVAVRAQYPNTGLGYIKIGHQTKVCSNGLEIYQVAQFVEKPTLARAKQFLHSYRYLWNTGLYVAPVHVLIEAYKQHSPEIYNTITKKKSYDSAPKISFDYAVIEHLKPNNMFVIPAELDWNDIGNWGALFDELTVSKEENVTSGNNISLETSGSLVISKGKKLVATYGVENMIIVDTPDVLLVMPKEKAAEVKKIVELIKSRELNKYL